MISLMVAASENNAIGKNNQLLWHLPADLQYFKEKTLNKAVIMGRKTFDSVIDAMGKPLPQRHNIVISRNPNNVLFPSLQRAPLNPPLLQGGGQGGFSNVTLAPDLSHALQYAEAWNAQMGQDEIMILGGGTIYEQALPLADKIYLTRVYHDFDGDTFFPVLDEKIWHVAWKEIHQRDEKNAYDYTFFVYVRETSTKCM